MNKEVLGLRVWLVMTGFTCNNNCIICSTKPKAKMYSDRTSAEIVNDLIKGRELGYERVDFTGGEPAIRQDIFYLINKSRELGYRQIGINTNARILSYMAFCEKLIKEGVNAVTITLNGHNDRLVDAIARTPGIFRQSIKGIKNISSFSEVDIAVNTVVTNKNYQYLQEIGGLISSFNIHAWHLLDLIPDGNGKTFYKDLSIEMLLLSDTLNKINITIKKLFQSIIFFDFLPCLFSTLMLNESKFQFITAQGRVAITKQVGYNPRRFSKTNNVYSDIHKIRVGTCYNCRFLKICAGVWEDYLDLHKKKGEKDIAELAKRHNCLIYDKR